MHQLRHMRRRLPCGSHFGRIMAFKIKPKLFSFLQLAGFIAASAAASFVALAPLWLLATKEPKIYSAAFALVAAALALFKAIRAAKAAGSKKTLFFLLKAAAILAGLWGAALSLTHWRRLFCALSLAAAVVLFQIISRLEKNAVKKDS